MIRQLAFRAMGTDVRLLSGSSFVDRVETYRGLGLAF